MKMSVALRRTPSPAVVISYAIGTAILGSLVVGATGGVIAGTERLLHTARAVVEEATFLINSSHSGGKHLPLHLRDLALSGPQRTGALLVLMHTENARGDAATDVTLSVKPASAFGAGPPISTSILSILASQTDALLLSSGAPQKAYFFHVNVGQWRSWAGASLPTVQWTQNPNGIQVRLSNLAPTASSPTRLVAVIFGQHGAVLGAGQRVVGRLATGTTRTIDVHITFGSNPSGGQAELFEEFP